MHAPHTLASRLARHFRINVVAYLALFVAMSGTAYATATIGSADIKANAVLSKHIKNGQVKNPDLGTNAVTGTKIQNETITSAKIQDGTITSADIADAPSGSDAVDADTFHEFLPTNFIMDGSNQAEGSGNLGEMFVYGYDFDTTQSVSAHVGTPGNTPILLSTNGTAGSIRLCDAAGTSVPYVDYVNGTRSTGTLNAMDCVTLSPGAAGDFQIYARRTLIFGTSAGADNNYFVYAINNKT